MSTGGVFSVAAPPTRGVGIRRRIILRHPLRSRVGVVANASSTDIGRRTNPTLNLRRRIGRLDDADAKGLPADDEVAIARVAAVREAQEETGLTLAADALSPFAHWTPPPIAPKRFLTWFFLARAPDDRIAIDHGEIREHAWMSSSQALAKRDAGEIELARGAE